MQPRRTVLQFFLLALPAVVLGLQLQSSLYYSEESPLTSSCPGQPNTHTPWSGQLVKVKEVENGSLYLAGDGDDQIYGKPRN